MDIYEDLYDPDDMGRDKSELLDYVNMKINIDTNIVQFWWLESVDSSPGHSKPTITMLNKMCIEEPHHYSTCSIHIDSIHIRKHVSVDKKTKLPSEFVDLGYGPTDELVAREVLVFMAVGTTGHWKAPIGYFLTTGLSAETQKELIVQSISQLESIRMKIY